MRSGAPLTDEELAAHIKQARGADKNAKALLDCGDVIAMIEEIQGCRTIRSNEVLAEYIFEWLETRNQGELAAALLAQRVGDRRLAIDELVHILNAGGKPRNWV